MTDMVEKVARAIDPEAFAGPSEDWFGLRPRGEDREVAIEAWKKQTEPYRNKARKQARAAIRTLMEPTEEMQVAGSGALGEATNPIGFRAAKACHKAMLKAALDD